MLIVQTPPPTSSIINYDRLTYIFVVAVVLPEDLDVDHGVDNAPLVHLPDGRDALVLRVRADSLAK